uniref:Uncharacterized protein n=1 Tax=Sphaerodactylus townsendi TaxID=933632 RepID=A0ACB8GBE8_9SAUR
MQDAPITISGQHINKKTIQAINPTTYTKLQFKFIKLQQAYLILGLKMKVHLPTDAQTLLQTTVIQLIQGLVQELRSGSSIALAAAEAGTVASLMRASGRASRRRDPFCSPGQRRDGRAADEVRKRGPASVANYPAAATRPRRASRAAAILERGSERSEAGSIGSTGSVEGQKRATGLLARSSGERSGAAPGREGKRRAESRVCLQLLKRRGGPQKKKKGGTKGGLQLHSYRDSSLFQLMIQLVVRHFYSVAVIIASPVSHTGGISHPAEKALGVTSA